MPKDETRANKLADVLHTIMEDRGIVSQREMARVCGVSHKVINMIVHDNHIPMASTLRRIETGLGLKRNELLIAAGYIDAPTPNAPQIDRIVSILENLEWEDVQEVIQYIQFRYLQKARKRGN